MAEPHNRSTPSPGEPDAPDAPAEELLHALGLYSYAITRSRTHERLIEEAGIAVERAGVSMLRTLRTQREPVRLSDLADLLLVRPPHVTRQVTRLEAAGLVQRTRDPGDQRAQRVELTRRGRAAVDRYHRAVLDSLAGALEGETAQDVRTAARILSKLSVAARPARPEPARRADRADRAGRPARPKG
ncbi:MarR family winged helix-turn-helix transcriptional regulator [Mangrovactinospora gilvigrisea]|uniref:MarR family winged helix-turn-helix transcriptional regulator n=1 Tax=Mangrovactinospora gilvigrisea TaxID=1428644 RepID=UPI001114B63D|nr:MarR family transcriptional regulator [Mangrovactinospora gilvigrisea]